VRKTDPQTLSNASQKELFEMYNVVVMNHLTARLMLCAVIAWISECIGKLLLSITK